MNNSSTTMLAILLLASCGSESAEVATTGGPVVPVERDSAGVSIRLHPAEAIAQAPVVTLDTIPLAVIAGSAEDASKDISTVSPELFLSDGRLVGLDRTPRKVVVFAADGSGWHSFGQRGAGPEDFGFLSDIRRLPEDKLLLYDPSNGRVVVATPDGDLLDMTSLSGAMGQRVGRPVGRVDNEFMLQGSFMLPKDPNTGKRRSAIKAAILSASGKDPKVVFRSEPEPPPSASGGASVIGVLAVSTLSSADFVSISTIRQLGNQFLVADADDWQFEVFGSNGKVSEVIGFDKPRVAVTDAMWQRVLDDAMAEQVAEGTSSQDQLDRLQTQLEEKEQLDSLPAWQNVQVTANNTIWFTEQQLPGVAGWSAVAFDAEGRLIGRLSADAGDPPVVFGDDRVLFRSEDDLGIATFTVRKLIF